MKLGLSEMVFILLLALVLVGPKKLPEVARQLGKFLAEFRRASNEFRSQLEAEMRNIELEERAKKPQEGPKVLRPEQPWERLMKPLTESVSRTKQELVSIVDPGPGPIESVAPPTPSDQASASAKSADND
ncbi:MAG: Sec-independent protein translocase protein TatB [Candidatus Korobacteraceae bacterium]